MMSFWWLIWIAIAVAFGVHRWLKYHEDPESFHDLLWLIWIIVKYLLMIFIWLCVLWGIIWLIITIFKRWKRLTILLLIILWLILLFLIPIWIGILHEIFKFRKRKELWLIKDGVKRKDFMDPEFEKKWYDSLSKEWKEKEDERSLGKKHKKKNLTRKNRRIEK